MDFYREYRRISGGKVMGRWDFLTAYASDKKPGATEDDVFALEQRFVGAVDQTDDERREMDTIKAMYDRRYEAVMGA